MNGFKLQAMSDAKTVQWVNGKVRMIDQTRVPEKLVYITVHNYRQVARAIREMVVRGAPAIGVAAAMAMALAANENRAKEKSQFLKELRKAGDILCKSRPTARNLFWAVDRVLSKAEAANADVMSLASMIEAEAEQIAREDVEANHKIGEFGSRLIKDGDRVLTHCNAGTLATVSYGTALAPIRTAVREGKKVSVIATETRPRLQGAKLTSFELLRDRIPVTLIVDGAAGYVMKKGMVQLVIVGADRITSNLVANKVGTYQIALAAKANHVPFYVAAPTSTFDLNGEAPVEIEERSTEEVTHIEGRRIAPQGVNVFNPAFDITPVKLVSGFITERGIMKREELCD
jgi:methylthioribose-1-phosphate isomerase